MATNTNVNNNSAVVVVGRTAPVPTGQQPAEKSIPVVIASDQEAIPVEEQNKQQSEVALSLLGIPRSEVALGIFADVNTYDVNPSEWTAVPEQALTIPAGGTGATQNEYTGIPGVQDWGLGHVPAEAGALVEAPANEHSILTSKRFFRYQPGRVSAGTFGVKFGRAPYTTASAISSAFYPNGAIADNGKTYLLAGQDRQVLNPSVKKYGVFDKFDGYYYESIHEGRGDNFCCVRRTQSLIRQKNEKYFYDPDNTTNPRQFGVAQYDDYGNMEIPGDYYDYHGDAVILRDGLLNIHGGLFDQSLLKDKREIYVAQVGADTSASVKGTESTELLLDPYEKHIRDFSYNNTTGVCQVTTTSDHGFKEGDSVTLKDILLTCNTGAKLYPNKYAQTLFRVESKAGNTLKVFVGKSFYDSPGAGGYNGFDGFSVAQAYNPNTGRVAEVSQATTQSVAITGWSYNGVTGVATVTVGSDNDTWYEGDRVKFGSSVTLAGTGKTSFPESFDPIVFYIRRRVDSRTFELQIGKQAVSGIDPATNTYVSGGTLGKWSQTIPATSSGDSYTITDFNYIVDQASADFGYAFIETTASNNIVAGDMIHLEGIETNCSYNPQPKIYPAKDDEDTFPIENVTSNTFQFTLKTSTILHTHTQFTGRCVSLGLRKGSGVYIYKNKKQNDGTVFNDLGVGSTIQDSIVDGGIYYVDGIRGSRVELTRAAAGDSNVFSLGSAQIYDTNQITPIVINTDAEINYKLTPNQTAGTGDGTNGGIVYNPTTGLMTINFDSAHNLETGDLIKIDDYSLIFTCNQDSHATEHRYPRSFNENLDGTPDPNGNNTANTRAPDPISGKWVPITVVDATSFTVQVLATVPSTDTSTHRFVRSDSNCIAFKKNTPYVVTPAPFVLPNTTNFAYRGTVENADPQAVTGLNPYGCFPYRYSYGTAIDDKVGFVTTDISLNTAANATSIKNDIDDVNKKLLKEWVYNHVKPAHWGVYEYRVPRSRFSGEKVHGLAEGTEALGTDVLYSDVVYSQGSQNFPGQTVRDETTGADLTRASSWNLNPENVTMYKIEFSWYGAVGALFLAYVPLDSGEARWVRVHHLRASNQLKVASLGNPTLPITYYVYGGGTEFSYGYKNDRRTDNTVGYSNSYSEFLVKYGASYYIDGGDRGTVRLFNYATPVSSEVYGSRLRFNITAGNNYGDISDNSDPYPYLDLAGATNTNGPTVTDPTFYIGATLVTPNREPNVKVSWVSGTKIYLSKPISGAQSGDFFLVLDRPNILVGLNCRDKVNGVRNRIQVYPTRLSIGNSNQPATIKLIKTPVFQTKDGTQADSTATVGGNKGNMRTDYTNGDGLTIGSIGRPTALEGARIPGTSKPYLENLTSTYGYFRGYYEGDNGNVFTIFGLLQRNASGTYLFSSYQKYSSNIVIFGDFLRAGEFREPNPAANGLDGSAVNPTSDPLTSLSAIAVSDEQRTPIPGTGQVITTLFTPSNSGEQFPLQQFFDYNKDYLSFPLTDEIENLFIVGSVNRLYDSSAAETEINAAITWEEQ